jgi:hypothetical protein
MVIFWDEPGSSRFVVVEVSAAGHPAVVQNLSAPVITVQISLAGFEVNAHALAETFVIVAVKTGDCPTW